MSGSAPPWSFLMRTYVYAQNSCRTSWFCSPARHLGPILSLPSHLGNLLGLMFMSVYIMFLKLLMFLFPVPQWVFLSIHWMLAVLLLWIVCFCHLRFWVFCVELKGLPIELCHKDTVCVIIVACFYCSLPFTLQWFIPFVCYFSVQSFKFFIHTKYTGQNLSLIIVLL
jgi:hypothetical protein